MLQLFRRKCATLWRYFFPDARDRRYLAAIRDSGLFDRAYYRSSNAGGMHPLFRIWPERHYVQLGERNGVCPGPGFSPRAYLFHNPDLAGEPQPLWHYITRGRAEGRLVLAPPDAGALAQLPPPAPPLHPARPAPVAVALHLYYPELWPEFARRLAAQRFAFDLYVTLTRRPDLPEARAMALEAEIRAAFPGARVWHLPNHGRDIFPFLWLLGAGVLAPYRAVCKLHSKRSPHRADGDDWRRALVSGVLGPPEETAARLARFLADPQAGLWVAPGHLYEGERWWGINRPRAEALLARAGLALPPPPLRFPAGSIYWARAEVLEQLAALKLGAADFEAEQALVEGTTAHVVERLMGPLAQSAGRRLLTTAALDADAAQPA